MRLGDLQREFTACIAELILWSYDQGYELTFGDAYRDPRVFGREGKKKGYGHRNSNHKRRLAVDLNLFKEGYYLTDTVHYKPLGEYWESLNTSAIWGGTFVGGDGNHFSFEYKGMK